MRVMSAGEKIKQLRMDIGLNQVDLANDTVTRSLISMIENNKRSLTANTAAIIAASLNRYYLNLGKEITPEYLLETEEKQAQRLIIEKYHEILTQMTEPLASKENDFEERFRRLIIFAEQWRLYAVAIEIMEARGRYFYTIKKYNEALKDFFTAQEYYLQNALHNKSAANYIMIGSCHNYLMLYEQALLYFDQADHIISSQITYAMREIKSQLSFQRLLCFRGLKKHDLVLQEISVYKSLGYLDEGPYHHVLQLEANTYRDLKNFDRAIQTYERLLKMAGQLSNDHMLMIYGNYAELYRLKGEYHRSLQHIEKARSYAPEGTADHIAFLSLCEAQCYSALDFSEQAISTIDQCLVIIPQITQKDLVLKLYCLLVELLIEIGNFQRTEIILPQFEAFVLDQQMKDQLIQVYSYYILLYCKTKDLEKCYEQTNKLLALRRCSL